MIDAKALVLLSGGQDSATSLFWAKQKFASVETISFRYGQRHNIELECAKKLASIADVRLTCIDLGFLSTLNETALTHDSLDPNALTQAGLPQAFVPGRNALFLTVSASFGVPRGMHHFIIGACQADFSGYPDCRKGFIASQQRTLSLALDTPITVHTPLMNATKAQAFSLAEQLGHLSDVLEHSHTCYLGEREQRHPWGYGCNACPACHLRKAGFETYEKEKD